MEDIKYEEQETSDKQFQDAFNSGYTLAKYDPEYLENILFDIGDSDKTKTEGLIWGKWQFEEEMKRDQIKELAKLRNKSRGKDRDLDLEYC